MKTLSLALGIFATSLFIFSCSKSKSSTQITKLSSNDSAFAVNASQGNMAEIQAGQVSLTNSQDSAVTNFGQLMTTDHTAAQASLDSIALTVGITLPVDTDSAHAAVKHQLMTLTGVAFDTVYVNAQIRDHQAMLALLSAEVNSGTNAQLKAYATTNLPIVQMHLTMADSLLVRLP